MFEPLYEILNKIKSINPNVVVNKSILTGNIQELIIELNTEKQLYEKGIDATGKKLSDIGGEYSPVTLEIANRKGRPKRSATHIDLKDTGAFYESHRVEIKSLKQNYFEIIANPIKTKDKKNIVKGIIVKVTTSLYDDWGEDITGLTLESKEILANELKEVLPNILRSELDL
jgi:hypothetical protein